MEYCKPASTNVLRPPGLCSDLQAFPNLVVDTSFRSSENRTESGIFQSPAQALESVSFQPFPRFGPDAIIGGL